MRNNDISKQGFSLMETLICLVILAVLGTAAIDTQMLSGKMDMRASSLRTMREHITSAVVAEYFDLKPADLVKENAGFETTSKTIILPLGTNIFSAADRQVKPDAVAGRGLRTFVRAHSDKK